MKNAGHFSLFNLISKAKEAFYGWKLVGISVFMLALMSLTVFQGLGTYLVALERGFGWSRTQLSLAFSLARGESAVLGPFEGWLIDKLGNRTMILIGYVVMGIGFIWFSQIEFLGSLGLLRGFHLSCNGLYEFSQTLGVYSRSPTLFFQREPQHCR